MIEPLEMEADRTALAYWVNLRVSAQGLTLEIRGVLDSDSLPALSAQLDQLQCSPCEEVVVDVRRVDVLDHAGCNAIASLAHYVPARGGRFVIRCEPGAIKGLLVSTGLGAHIEELAPPRLVGAAN